MAEITAREILGLLAIRHSGDVFVPECKDGPTQYVRGHSRLDAWTMPRSWAHPACTGYEIKVSRSDFLGDNKWQAYLSLCNLLYFVAPAGVIEKDEVPEGCGLLCVSKNGRMLRVAKKAPHRDVEIPEDLWRYILMCRANITAPNMNGGGVPKAVYWRNWLREKVEKRELGREVSRGLQETFRTRVTKVEAEQKVIEVQMRPLNDAKEILDSIGITLYSWQDRKSLRETLLKKFYATIPSALHYHVERAARELASFRDTLEKFDAEHAAPEPGADEENDG